MLRARALCALLLLAYACADFTYTTKYDDVNLDEILANERLLSGYIRCLMDEGPCTADAKELKKNLPDAIENGCSKCSEKQRDGSAKVMHYIIDHRPEDWVRLETIYDMQGNYRKSYLNSKNDSKEQGTGKTLPGTPPNAETTTEQSR